MDYYGHKKRTPTQQNLAEFFLLQQFVNCVFAMTELAAVSGVMSYDYGGVHQEVGKHMKLRKVFFASRTRSCYLWYFFWTRVDLNLSNRKEFNDSVKMVGVADEAGSYAFQDELRNNFRSFFIAYDVQDFWATKTYSQTVRKILYSSFIFLLIFFSLFPNILGRK